MAGCPPALLRPGATLGPDFAGEFIPEDRTHDIVQSFLDDLARLYDRPADIDRCRLFTEAGWQSALASDWRLRDVDQDELRFRQTHLLRIAFESENAPSARPPKLVFDAIFDIPPGAAGRDPSKAALRSASTGTERLGFRLVFLFDGRDWRVDEMGPVSNDNRQWTVLPVSVAAPKPCATFRDDPKGQRPFDERGNRPWCDGGGRGRQIGMPDELGFFTRYPCERGRAAILTIGRPLGQPIDPLVRWEYVRDPLGEFLVNQWLTSPYDGGATLPRSAAFTGWTNGNIDLWTDPATLDEAVYLVRGDTVERWPRAAPQWGVIDCN